MYKPETLTAYETPSCYFGAEYPEYFHVIDQTRDSDALSRANFDAMLKLLGGESKHSGAVIVHRASHWACGWIETIYIHKSASRRLKIADKAMKSYADYPVIDEELYSQYENEEKQSIWTNCYNLREKIALCVKAGESMFAARNEDIPRNVDMYIELN